LMSLSNWSISIVWGLAFAGVRLTDDHLSGQSIRPPNREHVSDDYQTAIGGKVPSDNRLKLPG